MIENQMIVNIREEEQTCCECRGTGEVPYDIYNLDDERTVECSNCGGKGWYTVRV